MRVRIRLPCPPPLDGLEWGDWFFAKSLAAAMERRGARTSFEFTPRPVPDPRLADRARQWTEAARQMAPATADLVLRGKVPFARKGRRPLYLWLISWPDSLTDTEIAEATHIFVASQSHARALAARGVRCSYLPQCTDPALFSPDRADPQARSGLLFVGNRRKYATRPIVEKALALGERIEVWGRHWEGHLPDGAFRGAAIPNADLGRHYASSEVILNDHSPDMLAHGFLNNRTFDGLACGRPVVTEEMEGMPPDLVAGLFTYGQTPLRDALAAARAADPAVLRALSRQVRAGHSFDRRAERILEVIAS